MTIPDIDHDQPFKKSGNPLWLVIKLRTVGDSADVLFWTLPWAHVVTPNLPPLLFATPEPRPLSSQIAKNFAQLAYARSQANGGATPEIGFAHSEHGSSGTGANRFHWIGLSLWPEKEHSAELIEESFTWMSDRVKESFPLALSPVRIAYSAWEKLSEN